MSLENLRQQHDEPPSERRGHASARREGRQPRPPSRSLVLRGAARSVDAGRWRRRATAGGHGTNTRAMIASAIPTLVLIGLAAVLAPLTAEALRRFVPVPEVVILILFGIMLGPSVLGLAHTSTIVTALSDFGLTFLMFLAGTELDLATMREGHL